MFWFLETKPIATTKETVLWYLFVFPFLLRNRLLVTMRFLFSLFARNYGPIYIFSSLWFSSSRTYHRRSWSHLCVFRFVYRFFSRVLLQIVLPFMTEFTWTCFQLYLLYTPSNRSSRLYTFSGHFLPITFQPITQSLPSCLFLIFSYLLCLFILIFYFIT